MATYISISIARQWRGRGRRSDLIKRFEKNRLNSEIHWLRFALCLADYPSGTTMVRDVRVPRPLFSFHVLFSGAASVIVYRVALPQIVSFCSHCIFPDSAPKRSPHRNWHKYLSTFLAPTAGPALPSFPSPPFLLASINSAQHIPLHRYFHFMLPQLSFRCWCKTNEYQSMAVNPLALIHFYLFN